MYLARVVLSTKEVLVCVPKYLDKLPPDKLLVMMTKTKRRDLDTELEGSRQERGLTLVICSSHLRPWTT